MKLFAPTYRTYAGRSNTVFVFATTLFRYVGGAPGKVDLYVGREMVKKGIPNAEACDALIDLIKEHGRWVEPEEAEKVEEAETVAAEASASA
eukprot:CAMPEP_0167789490 /NCGR_PEP_ID=MMETSP0111_2-20121227/10719_1 /TAXON_ID=91324 /ORGANISM="Lotharella globosa, Strain CCCM811" /LENGTH=91 /DNA_ID=CAMNT_0007681673 /DNA_START=251 /DNA_END=526 /DNA_ORIENTATION=+